MWSIAAAPNKSIRMSAKQRNNLIGAPVCTSIGWHELIDRRRRAARRARFDGSRFHRQRGGGVPAASVRDCQACHVSTGTRGAQRCVCTTIRSADSVGHVVARVNGDSAPARHTPPLW